MKHTINKMSAARSTRLILDTDMGNDIDDALALGMIHTLQSQGECELIGVVSSKDNPYSPVYIDIVNTFYGRGDIPIGIVRDGATPDDRTFILPVANARNDGRPRYPRSKLPDEYEDAVPLLRRLLAREPDNSVIMVMIGFSTNMAQLFDTPGDANSPLCGADLFAKKVKRVVAMAGNFSDEVQANPTLDNREYNIHSDVPSAVRFFNYCPTPITFCGYEVGCMMPYPAASITCDYQWVNHHPVAEAYVHYIPMPYDRPLWDPATILEAVRPGCGSFTLSPKGRVTVDEYGCALFKPEPSGRHRYLIAVEENLELTINEIVSLCSKPLPDNSAVRTTPSMESAK